MKSKGLIAIIIILSCLLVMMGAIIFLNRIPQNTLLKQQTTEVPKVLQTETYEKVTEPVKIDLDDIEPETSLSTNILHFNGYDGNVDIDYPEIVGLEDKEQQEKLNFKIMANALSIVGLYPISTALQTLNINCEVVSLDDNYITILYKGTVVGKDATPEYSNRITGEGYVAPARTGGTTTRKSSAKDPYLDGFVDPLAGQTSINGGYNVYSAPTYGAGQNNNIHSAPSTNVGNTVPRRQQTTAPQQSGSKVITDGDVTEKAKKHGFNVADSGPTDYIQPGPSATMNSNGNSAGPGVQSYNNTAETPITQIKTAIPSVSGSQTPSINGGVNTNAPYSIAGAGSVVNGFASTDVAATTINQKIFYANTIDIVHGVDVYLSEYADVDKLATYARSSDVEFVNVDEKNKKAVKEYIRKTVKSKLVEELTEKTDFRNKQLSTWPKHFSYQDDEYIYYTMKLTSALGNYAIIKYKK